MFEYKFVAAPKQVRLGGMMRNGPEALTRTLDSEIKTISGTGWEFVRTEILPVTGRWFLLPVTRRQPFMVFRRLLASEERPPVPEMPTSTVPNVRPRRVAPNRASTARPGALPA